MRLRIEKFERSPSFLTHVYRQVTDVHLDKFLAKLFVNPPPPAHRVGNRFALMIVAVSNALLQSG